VNYVSASATPPPMPAVEGGGFYRKTPNAKLAAGGGRFDLDVPAFLRKQGGGGPTE
jgi:hypothetical protein